MTVGIAGLGLIGGSMAKAYKEKGHKILALDKNSTILDFAILNDDVDAKLDKNNVSKCDLVIFALYPKATIQTMTELAPFIRKDVVVIDCCGTKRLVCKTGFELSEKYGFLFVGGHPMAGTHNSGYKYSRADMFVGAPMVIVPPIYDDMQMLDRIKTLLSPAGFKFISVTTAEKHDEMIGFTSQMAHIVSNGFIKSPTAGLHKGFSAGSYKDLTRVAWLNPQMWAELFLENKDNLINELDVFIENIEKYRSAIKNDDFDMLERLLDEGRRRKEEVDGK